MRPVVGIRKKKTPLEWRKNGKAFAQKRRSNRRKTFFQTPFEHCCQNRLGKRAIC